MDWNPRTVCVTGGGGFIGSHLVERLVQSGAKTRAMVHYRGDGGWGWLDSSVVRDDVEVVAGDVRDRDIVRRAVEGADTVFHLAALIAIPYSYRAPSSYVETNIAGTLNVLQACLDADVERVVHTSTSEVYGTALYVPIDENHPLQGQSPYSASKIGADKIAEAYHRSFGLPVATIRPFNTFGPRQSARAVIPTIISQALAAPRIELGNLDAKRDFTYVSDTVDGFLAVAESDRAVGTVVNVGSGKEVSIGELVQNVCNLTGYAGELSTSEERMRPDASEVDRLLASNERAQELLGWTPAHSLDEGLRETIRWIEENIAMYQVGAYHV